MRNATLDDILGWTPEDAELIDGRLGLIEAWMLANGRDGRAAAACAPLVDAWHRGRADVSLWRKATRQVLQGEIATALVRAFPGLADEPGCAETLAWVSQGTVLDLDGFWIPGMADLDLSVPAAALEPLVALVRAEGLAIEAEDTASRSGP